MEFGSWSLIHMVKVSGGKYKPSHVASVSDRSKNDQEMMEQRDETW